jgi:hypothetical protein
MWRRDKELRIERAASAERFIEDVGFANTLTDTRRAGPWLYIAVSHLVLQGRSHAPRSRLLRENSRAVVRCLSHRA